MFILIAKMKISIRMKRRENLLVKGMILVGIVMIRTIMKIPFMRSPMECVVDYDDGMDLESVMTYMGLD